MICLKRSLRLGRQSLAGSGVRGLGGAHAESQRSGTEGRSPEVSSGKRGSGQPLGKAQLPRAKGTGWGRRLGWEGKGWLSWPWGSMDAPTSTSACGKSSSSDCTCENSPSLGPLGTHHPNCWDKRHRPLACVHSPHQRYQEAPSRGGLEHGLWGRNDLGKLLSPLERISSLQNRGMVMLPASGYLCGEAGSWEHSALQSNNLK